MNTPQMRWRNSSGTFTHRDTTLSPFWILILTSVFSRRMLVKRIIPCLDVDGGRVVKGTKFLNLRDAGDPVECAKEYDRQGADELVFLDITASSDNRATMIDVVERTANECFMPSTVGGVAAPGVCGQPLIPLGATASPPSLGGDNSVSVDADSPNVG